MGLALARFARIVLGLVVVAGAVLVTLLVAAGLILRMGWLRLTRRHAPATAATRAASAGGMRRAMVGEVVDIEAREIPSRPR